MCNVIPLFRKTIQPPLQAPSHITDFAERMQRVKDSINRINAIMALKDSGPECMACLAPLPPPKAGQPKYLNYYCNGHCYMARKG